MDQHPNPNLTFVWVDVESAWDPWRPAKGEKGIQVHYLMWLKVAYARGATLCRELDIDVAHHVSWGTLRAAPPIWTLPVPTVWGPVGGGQSAPFAFWRYFGRSFGQEVVRALSSQALRFSRSFRRAAKTAAVVFVTNEESARLLKRVPGARVEYLLDCGLPADWMLKEAPGERKSDVFRLLWVGRLEYRKALLLALQALSKVHNVPVHLSVAGVGPLRRQLELAAQELGVSDRIEFLGSVSYHDMPALFQNCDAFLFTSLRDSFGSVVLEAMAQGLPIVTLNHQGVGAFVPAEAGVKVPVTTPERTIQALSEAIETLGRSPSLCQSMRRAALNFAKQQSWDRRAQQMIEIYRERVARAERHSATIDRTSTPTTAREAVSSLYGTSKSQ